MMRTRFFAAMIVAVIGCQVTTGYAQAPPPFGPRGPQVVSPEVLPDRHVVFRILAPKATSVRLTASDVPGTGPGVSMSKGDNGVWETTLGPLDPGAYRYTFDVDGVSVVDPRSPAISESYGNVWSLVDVPGSDLMDTREVPHGEVAAVTYYSTALSRFRRMHVYTPPGYEQSRARYPVFYLLHGAGDCDESWTSVGRAGFILDNLIAEGKARPMVIVMPAGHTRPLGQEPLGRGPLAPPALRNQPPVDDFVQDFVTDIMPYIEQHYRVRTDRDHRAIAGLSMGGSQTLAIALAHPDEFAYVGVFSSGLLGAFRLRPPGPPPPSAPGGPAASPGPAAPAAAAAAPASASEPPTPARPSWEEQHAAELDSAGRQSKWKLFWFSTGKDDFLLRITQSTVEMLKKHGFNPVMQESTGAHTWLNWRNYLIEFAPRLFH